jgi:hypothetical protein
VQYPAIKRWLPDGFFKEFASTSTGLYKFMMETYDKAEFRKGELRIVPLTMDFRYMFQDPEDRTVSVKSSASSCKMSLAYKVQTGKPFDWYLDRYLTVFKNEDDIREKIEVHNPRNFFRFDE